MRVFSHISDNIQRIGLSTIIPVQKGFSEEHIFLTHLRKRMLYPLRTQQGFNR
jgi:hypothetical protein